MVVSRGLSRLNERRVALSHENIIKVRDDVLNEIYLIATIVRDLDSPACGTDSNRKKCLAITPNKNFEGTSCKLVHDDRTCLSLQERRALTDFDDLKYWIQLPIPSNYVSQRDRVALRRFPLSDQVWDKNKTTYARLLYFTWVNRLNDATCRVTECLSAEDAAKYTAKITQSFERGSAAINPLGNEAGIVAFTLKGGSAAKISLSQNDPHPVTPVVELFVRKKKGSPWVSFARDVRTIGTSYVRYATPEDVDIGVRAQWVAKLFNGRETTPAVFFAIGPQAQTDPMTAAVRCYDGGETQKDNWQLEVKIDVIPQPNQSAGGY